MSTVIMDSDGLNPMNFPSNSKLSKPTQKEKPKLEKAISGEAKFQKKSVGTKFKEMLIPANFSDIKSYAINDILIPSAKAGFMMLMEMMLYNKVSPGRRTFWGGGTDYSRISSSSNYIRDAYGRPVIDLKPTQKSTPKQKNVLDIDDILIETRAEAATIISILRERIKDYGVASVGDLYSLLGEKCDYVTENYGWKDLSTAGIKNVRGGFMLDLPRPVYLEV